MNKKTIYLLVCGINTIPSSSENWTGRGVTYIMKNSPHKAEKIEYLCGPIGRAFGQKNRVNKLLKTLEFYDGWNIILIGHSNGCSVITEMIKTHDNWPNITHIHLIAGASEGDFDKNNFNESLKNERIGKISIYICGKDFMLKLARTWIGKFLKYKTLGLHGAYQVDDEIEGKVKTFRNLPWLNYGHSDCWSDENFEETMKLFI